MRHDLRDGIAIGFAICAGLVIAAKWGRSLWRHRRHLKTARSRVDRRRAQERWASIARDQERPS